jgi:2-amino-4-hydroxy-6-hydroxymethyldihydropteridine diphosphokinase
VVEAAVAKAVAKVARAANVNLAYAATHLQPERERESESESELKRAMRDSVLATVGLGANLGNAALTVKAAIEAIGALPGVELLRASALYRSAPVDSSGPDYINAVVQINTRLSAPVLLLQLQTLEAAAARERPYRNAPRTLDLDLLLYGEARVDSPALTIPHPRMQQRAFVLRPLAEIAPQLVSKQSLAAVHDQLVWRSL